MKAPCKNCEERVPKCHSVCPKYKAYRDSLAQEKKERQKFYDVDSLRAESVVRLKRQHRKEHTA